MAAELPSQQEIIDNVHHLMAVKTSVPPAADPRFDETTALSKCYQYFADYRRCKKRYGTDPVCRFFKDEYMARCPMMYINKYQAQIEKGAFVADKYD